MGENTAEITTTTAVAEKRPPLEALPPIAKSSETNATSDTLSKEQVRAKLRIISMSNQFNETMAQFSDPATTETPVQNHKPSLLNRVRNVITTSNVRIMARGTLGASALATTLQVFAAAKGIPALGEMATPAVLFLSALSLPKLIKDNSIPLSHFTSIKKDAVVFPKKIANTGINITFGDQIGSLHMMDNLRDMSRLSPMQRKVDIPLSGLWGLMKLALYIRQNKKEVADIATFKVTSHLVYLHKELFEDMGFMVEDKKEGPIKRFINNLFGKTIFLAVFGKKGAEMEVSKSQTAWITPQRLLEYEPIIRKKYDILQKLSQKVALRQTKTAA